MRWNELDELIFANWYDLDRAAARAQQLDDAVFEAFYTIAEEWCSSRGWVGAFDPKAALWFAPPTWNTSQGKRPAADAWFELEVASGDEEDVSAGDDFFWLTRLMRAGAGTVGFRVKQERRPKREWGTLLRATETGNELADFTLDDEPSLFLPIAFTRAEIEQGFREGNLEAALDALTPKLLILERAVPAIERLLGARKDVG